MAIPAVSTQYTGTQQRSLLVKPPPFTFSGSNCAALSPFCTDPRTMQKGRHQFYLHYSIDSAILLLHTVTPRAAAFNFYFSSPVAHTQREARPALWETAPEPQQTHRASEWKLFPPRRQRGREALCTQFDHLQKRAHAEALSRYFIRRNMSAIICENSF